MTAKRLVSLLNFERFRRSRGASVSALILGLMVLASAAFATTPPPDPFVVAAGSLSTVVTSTFTSVLPFAVVLIGISVGWVVLKKLYKRAT